MWSTKKYQDVEFADREGRKLSLLFVPKKMSKAILVTGRPGAGKMTFVSSIVGRLTNRAGGLVTQAIRVRNRRVGFQITHLNGDGGILVHVGHPSQLASITSGPRQSADRIMRRAGIVL